MKTIEEAYKQGLLDGEKIMQFKVRKLIDEKMENLKPKEFRSVRYVEEILGKLKEELNK